MSVKEQIKIIECHGKFGAAMLNRVLEKMRAGYSGWDNQECAAYMQRQLTKHASQGDYIDVSNIAMFLWNLEQRNKENQND